MFEMIFNSTSLCPLRMIIILSFLFLLVLLFIQPCWLKTLSEPLYSIQIFFLVNLTLLIYYPSNYCFECSYFHYFNEIYVFSEVILNSFSRIYQHFVFSSFSEIRKYRIEMFENFHGNTKYLIILNYSCLSKNIPTNDTYIGYSYLLFFKEL